MIRARGLSIAILLAAACGGSQDTKPVNPNEGMAEQTPPTEPTEPTQPTEPAKPTEPPAPPPKKLTTEELVKAHDACFAAFLAKDEKKMTDCYTADATAEMVDSGMPAAKGQAANVQEDRALWTGFPDIAGGTVANIASGNTLAHIAVITGTNTGEFAGQKPSGKKMGMMALEMVELSDDGKHQNVRLYVDQATMAGHLGWHKNKVRAFMDAPKGEPKVAIGTDSETERKNVQTITDGFAAFNKKDWKALEAIFADDAVLADQNAPADVKGKKNVMKQYKEFHTAFPDVNVAVGKIWGAGDYVVVEDTFSGTNNGASKALGIKKKTGKPVTTHSAHVFKLEGGKVKEHWHFGNGMALAMQLGLMAPPGQKGAEKPGAEPAKPAEPAKKTP